MPYIDFRATVKKVNLKPGGKKEILLEVNDSALDGKLDVLSEMIDHKAEVTIDSLIVNYNVTINAKTNEPMVEYRVDEQGVVHEVKPQEEQMEMDLNLPPEKIPTKEVSEEVEVNIVDEFIFNGLAPTYEDLPYDFESILKRKREGETYMKIASELNMSSGKIVELVDEYRKRVAQLAKKWWEWKVGKQPKVEPESKEEESEKEGNDAA